MAAVPDIAAAHPPGDRADPRQDWSAAGPPVLRHRRDGILPTTAAALSRPGAATLTATAARTGRPPRPHPLVREALDQLGPQSRERHDGRCPEVALLSRRLTDAGASDLASARAALDGAGITTRHIREDGDPRHGRYAPHCHSCTALLARFGVRSVSPGSGVTVALRMPRQVEGAGRAEETAEAGTDPTEEPLVRALTAAGWQSGRRYAPAAGWADALRAHRSPQGHRHAVTGAAVAAWTEYGGLEILPRGPGRSVASVPVAIDPLRGRHWARTLGDLGAALGRELSPLGVLGPCESLAPAADPGVASGADHEAAAGVDTGLLAVDGSGAGYCLDHTGDWYLGPNVRAALATLLVGRLPVRLATVDG